MTQHYTYTDDHIKELLWASPDQLLAHAHHIANDNHCAIKGDLVAFQGSDLVIYFKVQSMVHGCIRTKAQRLQFGVTCNLDAHLNSTGCALLYNGSNPLMMCHVHQCCSRIPICPCWDTCDPHGLDDANLHEGPGLFLGEQSLVVGQFDLPTIHLDFASPEVPPASPPLGVLPDQYIPDLACDSDLTESMPVFFPPNDLIANNDDIIDLDHLLPSDNMSIMMQIIYIC